MTLAQQFDAALQATIVNIGGIQQAKAEMSGALATMIKAAAPQADDLLCLNTAAALIDHMTHSTQDIAAEKGIDAARFGKNLLASGALKGRIVEACFELFTKITSGNRHQKRIAADAEFIRSNTAPRHGLAIDGKVY